MKKIKSKINIKVMRADSIGESDNTREQISKIFVEGFNQWLTYFSKDEDKLIRTFSHMFKLDCFYIAVVNGKIAGIAACTDGKKPCVKLNPKECRKHLGFVMGSIACYVLKKEFENHPYPFKLEPHTGSVEFVATGRDYRSMGIASSIIKHIFNNTDYTEYVLEVADTNENAVKLYTKLGFEEFTRVKMKNPKRSGVNHLVYMKSVKRL